MGKRLIVMLWIMLIMVGCSSELQPDRPEHTALLLNHSIFHQDFDAFVSLFSEARKAHIEEQQLIDQFEQLVRMKQDSSGGMVFTNYELLVFDHGEMVLVSLTPNNNGRVEIEDIQFVPDELKNLLWKKE